MTMFHTLFHYAVVYISGVVVSGTPPAACEQAGRQEGRTVCVRLLLLQ